MEKVQTNMNLLNLFNPGIYKIICTVNKKEYIGESSNILNRLGRHTESLENNRHDCIEMQNDFHKYSKKNFIFTALEIDSKYENKKQRKQRKKFLIQQIPEELHYNRFEPLEYSRSRGIRIRGQIYPSLSNVSQILNESRTNIVRKALNLENQEYVFLTNEENFSLNLQQEYKFHISCSCIIDGHYYNSFNEAARALGIHHKTVKNKILSEKWPTYLSGELSME